MAWDKQAEQEVADDKVISTKPLSSNRSSKGYIEPIVSNSQKFTNKLVYYELLLVVNNF